MKCAYTLLAAAAAATWAQPLGGHNGPFVYQSPSDDLNDVDPIDRGFVISQMGPIERLPDHTGRTAHPDWVQFDTDACGMLDRITDGRSILKDGALGDKDLDEEEDPSSEGRDLISSWLSAHAEIAVIGDAVGKWCGDDWFDDDDDDDPDTSEIA